MSQVLTVNLNKPIESVTFLNGCADRDASRLSESGRQESESEKEKIVQEELLAEKAVFVQACQTLNEVISKLNQFYGQIFAGHREEIARLSVEIARKVLVQKVDNGDYEIESIIKEALQNVPSGKDVIVHTTTITDTRTG